MPVLGSESVLHRDHRHAEPLDPAERGVDAAEPVAEHHATRVEQQHRGAPQPRNRADDRCGEHVAVEAREGQILNLYAAIAEQLLSRG